MSTIAVSVAARVAERVHTRIPRVDVASNIDLSRDITILRVDAGGTRVLEAVSRSIEVEDLTTEEVKNRSRHKCGHGSGNLGGYRRMTSSWRRSGAGLGVASARKNFGTLLAAIDRLGKDSQVTVLDTSVTGPGTFAPWRPFPLAVVGAPHFFHACVVFLENWAGVATKRRRSDDSSGGNLVSSAADLRAFTESTPFRYFAVNRAWFLIAR